MVLLRTSGKVSWASQVLAPASSRPPGAMYCMPKWVGMGVSWGQAGAADIVLLLFVLREMRIPAWRDVATVSIALVHWLQLYPGVRPLHSVQLFLPCAEASEIEVFASEHNDQNCAWSLAERGKGTAFPLHHSITRSSGKDVTPKAVDQHFRTEFTSQL